MPRYQYKHPETGEVFDDFRLIADRERPYVADDGTRCPLVPWWQVERERCNTTKHPKGAVDKGCEVWQKDPDYVKRLNPRWIKRRDGVRERFDPTRHRAG